MPSSSPPVLERATALFGTIVRIRAAGCDRDTGMTAITAAFGAMARIHRRMSFHEPGSDLGRLHRRANGEWVRVAPSTFAVLEEALVFARASHGVFDPTIAPRAVEAGDLPRPEGAPDPDPESDWRDVQLCAATCAVRFARPLWLDLGGVAKGYAVDTACEILTRRGVPEGLVEAGGDLRVFGPGRELVALDSGASAGARRGVWLRGESLASSGCIGRPRGRRLASHFDGRGRRPAPRRFVSVASRRCIDADALTKVVMSRGEAADDLLRTYGARAAICRAGGRWSTAGVQDDE